MSKHCDTDMRYIRMYEPGTPASVYPHQQSIFFGFFLQIFRQARLQQQVDCTARIGNRKVSFPRTQQCTASLKVGLATFRFLARRSTTKLSSPLRYIQMMFQCGTLKYALICAFYSILYSLNEWCKN